MRVFSRLDNQFDYHPLGIIGSITINYADVQCLEMAYYYLQSKVNEPRQRFGLLTLSPDVLHNLDYWLKLSPYRDSLKLDGSNSVMWPFTSFFDVEWFLRGLKYGINEDTITAMAADQANYDIDMANLYAEDSEGCYSLADVAYNDSFRSAYQYYCDIATRKAGLIKQLHAILDL